VSVDALVTLLDRHRLHPADRGLPHTPWTMKKEEQGLAVATFSAAAQPCSAPIVDSRPTCALYSKHANLSAIVAFTPGRVILP